MPTVQKRKMSNRRRSSVIDTKDDLKERTYFNLLRLFFSNLILLLILEFRRASLLQQDEIIAEPTFKKPLDQEIGSSV